MAWRIGMIALIIMPKAESVLMLIKPKLTFFCNPVNCPRLIKIAMFNCARNIFSFYKM